MSLDPKTAGLIGFAARSRKLLLGSYSVEQGIRQNKAKLVLAAGDMNPKRIEKLRLWCGDMGIPFLVAGRKEDYGALLRKSPFGLLALTDEHMVSGIIQEGKTNGGD
ncbi:MAG: ribosomal L7Ae/L30e/S12e/Gadd45 family protein [Clostridiales bacterium]|nr:ribosomal L7Ae/L30e/S12e/Gadd45 family protein [Clostridiales bacterium]